MKMVNLRKDLGGKERARHGFVPNTMCPGWSIQAKAWFAFRLHPWLGKLELLVVLMSLVRAPDEEWQWTGKRCRGRDGRGRLGGIAQGFRVRHLSVHHLHLGNNNLSKASKEVHVILVTPEKTRASLLGNVCFSSMQHLFWGFSFPTQLQVHLAIFSLALSFSLSLPHEITLVSTNLEAEPNPVIAYLRLLSIFRQKNISGHKVLCLFPEARFNDITWMTTTL